MDLPPPDPGTLRSPIPPARHHRPPASGWRRLRDRAVHRRVFARFAAGDAAVAADLRRLTERELDVLWLVARGMTNHEVADRLGVGEATAKTHVSRVLTKLGVRDRVQAVIVAHRAGFADTDRALG